MITLLWLHFRVPLWDLRVLFLLLTRACGLPVCSFTMITAFADATDEKDTIVPRAEQQSDEDSKMSKFRCAYCVKFFNSIDNVCRYLPQPTVVRLYYISSYYKAVRWSWLLDLGLFGDASRRQNRGYRCLNNWLQLKTLKPWNNNEVLYKSDNEYEWISQHIICQPWLWLICLFHE